MSEKNEALIWLVLETLVRTIHSRLNKVYEKLSGEEEFKNIKKTFCEKGTNSWNTKKPLKELFSEKKTRKVSEKVRVFLVIILIITIVQHIPRFTEG